MRSSQALNKTGVSRGGTTTQAVVEVAEDESGIPCGEEEVDERDRIAPAGNADQEASFGGKLAEVEFSDQRGRFHRISVAPKYGWSASGILMLPSGC